MNRQQKEQVIEKLKNDFQKSTTSFLVGYKGLDVAQMITLRNQLREKGGSFKVAKVTLMRRVAQEVPEAKVLSPLLKDQIAFVFSQNESPAIAKVLYNFSKEHEQLHLLGGSMDSQLLSRESIIILASLPPREILLAKVCGTLKSPLVSLSSILNMLILRFILILKQIEQKKSAK